MRTPVALYPLTAAAATLVLALFLGPPVAPVSVKDTRGYSEVSLDFEVELAQDRPPGYPTLIRVCRFVAGESWEEAMVRTQIGLIVVLAGLLTWILQRRGIHGALAAAVTVAACATPSLVYYSRVLIPEVLMAACLTFAWIATLRAMEGGSASFVASLAGIAGFWSGAAALTKPVWILGAVPLALALLVWGSAPAKTRRLSAGVLVVVHAVLVLGWQIHLIRQFDQLRVSRVGTIALNLAAIRHGMTELGAGTPLYRYLEENGLLEAAKSLRYDDLDEFGRIKDAIPLELRRDTEFEKKVVRDHWMRFVGKQLPRLPAFFSTRPIIDTKLVRRGDGLVGAVRSLHARAYAAYFRVRIVGWNVSPCLVLLLVGLITLVRDPRLRAPYFLSLLFLGVFVLMTVPLSFQDSNLPRYRTEVEPVLVSMTLLALIIGLGSWRRRPAIERPKWQLA